MGKRSGIPHRDVELETLSREALGAEPATHELMLRDTVLELPEKFRGKPCATQIERTNWQAGKRRNAKAQQEDTLERLLDRY